MIVLNYIYAHQNEDTNSIDSPEESGINNSIILLFVCAVSTQGVNDHGSPYPLYGK